MNTYKIIAVVFMLFAIGGAIATVNMMGNEKANALLGQNVLMGIVVAVMSAVFGYALWKKGVAEAKKEGK